MSYDHFTGTPEDRQDLLATISGMIEVRAQVRIDEKLKAIQVDVACANLPSSIFSKASVVLTQPAALDLALRLIGSVQRLRRLEMGGLTLLLIATGSMLLGAPAYAQTEQHLQSVINRFGYSCPQVTHAEGVGMVEGGDVLIGAVCSDGERYVLQMEDKPNRYTFKNVLRCWALRASGADLPFCR